MSAYPASAAATPARPPWAGLTAVDDAALDYAVGDRVHWQGHVLHLRPGDLVVAMERAARGPVVAVQSAGSTVLEQLRIGGDPLVLDAFHDESRHLQGLAVDPTGHRVAYALTSSSPHGPFGLAVRDLATGAMVVSRGTGLSFAVRDWVPSGVLLEAVADEARPPFVWRPGRAEPSMVTPPSRSGPVGPSLLAASSTHDEWAVRVAGCTAVVRLGAGTGRSRCLPALARPAAWSAYGDRIAGRDDHSQLLVVEARTGRTVTVTTLRRMFLAQLVWQDDGSLLAAVHTLADHRGAVLVWPAGGGVLRLRLGAAAHSPDLVLAQ
jgi:hypothetical protein